MSLQKIVQCLSPLPRELAHQILSDIRIWDILRLLIHNNPNVTTDILTHPHLRKVLPEDPQALNSFIQTATLYRDVCAAHHLQPAPLSSPLAKNTQAWKSDYKDLTNYMHSRIFLELRLDGWKHEILSRHTPPESPFPEVWDYSTISNMQTRWNTIQAAQATLNQRRAMQLRHAADLLEANPDILKKTRDPSQTPRKNPGHVVQLFRRLAERGTNRSLLRGDQLRGLSYFFYAFFPVMPFDEALGVVVNGLEGVGVGIGELFADEGSECVQKVKLEVEGEIEEAIWVVMEGLRWVYRAEDEAGKRVKRVERLEGGTVFVHPMGPEDAWADSREGLAWQYEVHDEREARWLEAFVKIYRYFERLESKDKGV
ncbi:hypothetical protein BDV23DRAFT_192579 [Aspergillus alliaceus]|uniref:Uncharacterized protein n=1 Tax=Petromyces alliaceus TaxID=209559 RepID=A0A5N7CE88_PETAA|nr:hypothetical protein BDV23DRAFT_192579 [Aspergillus alliaceus]